MNIAHLKTPLGTATIYGDTLGVTAINISDEMEFLPAPMPDHFKEAANQLHAYFDGSLKTFDLTLNPVGTPFQKSVWAALQDIPYGKTISYLELAKMLGDEKKVRAVASANAKNPLWVVVPCHRVMGTDGSLTGYAGGLYRKEWLLNHERPHRQSVLFE